MKLRSCTADDADAVLALWKAAGTAGSLTDTAEAIAKRLERDTDLFLLAEIDGRLAGTLIGGWDGWRGSLYRLAVHPDFRRQGIARALVQEIETRLRQKGARRVTALVLHAQDGAQRFWSAAGYADDPSIRRYVRNL